jgi:protein gp37
LLGNGGKDIAMSKAKFNKTNKNVGWATYTWSPVTGCLGPAGDGHCCPYCYAKKMAERFNQGFEPTFHPDRLDAPGNTPVPEVGNTRVFVCSMGELFGPWVPGKWIEKVFEAVRANSQWTFLFLTKFPERLVTLNFPENAWIGATIDRQERVQETVDALFLRYSRHRQLKSNKLFLSCEPLLEKIEIPALGWLGIDWLIVGALSKGTKKVQPDPAWVKILLSQAHGHGVPVWMKDNLVYRIQEVPQEPIILGTRSKTETRIAG